MRLNGLSLHIFDCPRRPRGGLAEAPAQIGGERRKTVAAFFKTWIAGAAFWAAFSWAQAGVGLTTRYVDVVLDGLQTGRAYDISRSDSQVFSITNPGSEPLTVAVEPQSPLPGGLKPGYEPVPDASWIKIDPARFPLAPGETRSARVTLTVPADPRWTGRHFQASLWTRTVEGPITAGLRSRVRFSVQVPRPAAAEKVSPISLEAAFDPRELVLKGTKGKIRISNSGKAPLVLTLRSVPFAAADVPLGWVPAPDPNFLEVAPARLEIPAGGTAAAALSLSIPKGDAHRGRRYVFLIRADAPDRPGAQPLFSRVYAQAGR
ncbi:MAG: hypothetical protein ACT4O3_05880 [Elusimicrobiota bacterium]